MTERPIIAAETASDLRLDISKIAAVLCFFAPLCSILASIFVSLFEYANGSYSEEVFTKSSWYSVYTLTLSLIPILLIIIALSIFLKRKFSRFMLKPTCTLKNFFSYTALGLLALPIGSAVSAFTTLIFNALNLKISAVSAPVGSFQTVAFILAHVIFAPLFEEILFRGIILERLRRYGDVFSVIASAFLFALLHSSLQSLPFSFVAGIIFGLLALLTGSPLSSIIVHFFNNLISVISIILSSQGKENLALFITYSAFVIIFICSACVFYLSKSRFSFNFNKGVLKTSRKLSLFFSSFTMLIFILFYIFIAISSLAI